MPRTNEPSDKPHDVSAASFALPQWPEVPHSPTLMLGDHSSGDEHYKCLDNLLDMPRLRTPPAGSTTPPAKESTPEEKSNVSIVPSVPSTGPSKLNCRYQKRREQNRNAQRAYRERKGKYIRDLLQLVDEMNESHSNLWNAYKTLQQEAVRLQGQVQDLKGQLELWNKAQVVMVKFPGQAAPPAPLTAPQDLLAGSHDLAQVLDILPNLESAYPAI
ncbi:bZIP transcription factor [Aspergillus clavatus NRRL 1]|uniref:BZIP transcription factor, putative n=1 Tax=Aspergillus clavatus (strain ATCC 1007 / CBS 513.65 / DSM 816 / NCTC 3887 / NRRL 1 / QM 1276 / 107) TaxID=344612 RepID=A1CDI7_ASPCL|nr:bZIP transcription factor, putative [Aspergillus clavatus NRRL 1]EAW11914.1 bZIP transcription factor, putative [Aspergillus clavatus NRRL 1]